MQLAGRGACVCAKLPQLESKRKVPEVEAIHYKLVKAGICICFVP